MIMNNENAWALTALLRRAVFVSILAQRCQLTSHDMTKWTCKGQPIWKSEKHIFQTSALDLWPHSRYCQDQLLHQFLIRTLNGSVGRALRDTRTHTHMDTHGTDFIPSTADAGGKYEFYNSAQSRCSLSNQGHGRGKLGAKQPGSTSGVRALMTLHRLTYCHWSCTIVIAWALAPGSYKQVIPQNRVQMG